MSWKPTKEQKEFLLLVLSMTTDCFLGKGTETVESYVLNLRTISDLIPKSAKPSPEVDRCGGVSGRIFTPQIKGV